MGLNEYIESIKNKAITVIGAGISNRPLIQKLCSCGVEVTVCDRSETLHPELSGLTLNTMLGAGYLEELPGDIIFRTPGLHPHHPALLQAKARGALITSEMEVFLALCPCKIIAVTGSDGKTTTTSLIAELMRAAGYKVHLGGNIGRPLLCHVDEMNKEDYVVLELSSFQLHSLYCRPDVAVITNISPNHLDVHPDYADYIQAKKMIFLNQTPAGKLVLNRDNETAFACAVEAKADLRLFSRQKPVENGIYLGRDGVIYASEGGTSTPILAAEELRLPGVHNIENTMAAFAAVHGLVSLDVMKKTAMEFSGVAHRLETVKVHRGVCYINDSIATSPSRTISGLSCFRDKLILIAGGKDKGADFSPLGDSICEHVKSLHLTGPTSEKILSAVENSALYDTSALKIECHSDFRQAVLAAAGEAGAGDTVLLSPASTSFDRFRNFEERGDTFRNIVNELE